MSVPSWLLGEFQPQCTHVSRLLVRVLLQPSQSLCRSLGQRERPALLQARAAKDNGEVAEDSVATFPEPMDLGPWEGERQVELGSVTKGPESGPEAPKSLSKPVVWLLPQVTVRDTPKTFLCLVPIPSQAPVSIQLSPFSL